jgi:outer membrane murein-binding lipoprotein Lpp
MNLRGLCLFCAVVLLASCSDRAQELEEKVTQMQRQLDQTEKQLQAANQARANRAAAESATPTSSVATVGLPSRDAVEQSYAASVAAFRKELDSKLKDFRVQSCTTHSVQMPTELFPFTSQLSLTLLSTDGKNFTTDIPVKADVTGKWVFPSVSEVTQRIENAGRMAAAAGGRSPTRQNQTAGDQPAPYMKVDGTFVIQWPNSNPDAAPVPTRAPATAEATAVPTTPLPPAPPPQSPPPAREVPKPVMPTDRDVHVQFPSPP